MSEDLTPDWTSECGDVNKKTRTDDLNQTNVEMFCFSLLMFAVGSIIITITDSSPRLFLSSFCVQIQCFKSVEKMTESPFNPSALPLLSFIIEVLNVGGKRINSSRKFDLGRHSAAERCRFVQL